MPKDAVKEKALPVGLFILLGLALLIGGILWLRSAALRPAYTFTVRYNDPGKVAQGIAAYYRGVQVGRVTEVRLADDFDSTLVTIGIDREDLRLPDTVNIYIRMEGITGQRYVEIDPPETDGRITAYIRDGEIIQGAEQLTWEKIQAQLNRIAEERVIEKTLKAAQEGMEKLADASDDIESAARQIDYFLANNRGDASQAIRNFSRASREVELAAADVSGFVRSSGETLNETLPELAEGLNGLNLDEMGLDETLVSVRQAADRFGRTFESINLQLRETGLIYELSDTLGGVQQTFGEVSETVQGIGGRIEEVGTVLGGGPPAEIRKLQQLLASLEEANDELAATLRLYEPETPAEAERERELLTLHDTVRHNVALAIPAINAADEPEELKDRLQSVEAFTAHVRGMINELYPLLEAPALRAPLARMEGVAVSLGVHAEAYRDDAVVIASRMETSGQGGLGGLFGSLSEIGDAAESVDCVASQLNHILGQRFLGFKLFFGRPGEGFSYCVNEQPRGAAPEAEPSPGPATEPEEPSLKI